MIRLLLEHGAAVDARGIAHDWERRVTAEPRIKIMQTGGFTPLLYAAREGCAACVEPLVAGGADVDLSDPYGMTPLVLALYNRQFDTAVDAHRARCRRQPVGLVGPEPAVSRDRAEPHSGQPPRRLAGARPAHGPRRRAFAARARRQREHALEASAAAAQRARRPRLHGRQPRRARREPRRDGAARRRESQRRRGRALLLAHGANVHAANVFGITPVMAAAGVGHWYGVFREFPTIGRYKTGADAVATMKLLLAAGADARRPHDGAQYRFPAAARRGPHGRARRRVPGLERGHRIPARAGRADRREADERRRRRRRAMSRSPKGTPETAALIERLLAE